MGSSLRTLPELDGTGPELANIKLGTCPKLERNANSVLDNHDLIQITTQKGNHANHMHMRYLDLDTPMLGFSIPGLEKIFWKYAIAWKLCTAGRQVDVDSTFFRVPYHRDDGCVEYEGCPIRKGIYKGARFHESPDWYCFLILNLFQGLGMTDPIIRGHPPPHWDFFRSQLIFLLSSCCFKQLPPCTC